MAIFTVHLPPAAPGQRPAAEKIVFLRDEFSWVAFIFGPLWLVWNRAFLAALLWTLVLLVVGSIGWKLRLPRDAMSCAGLALAAWLGFEGNRLIAWTLRRRGYLEDDVVVGENAEEAEAVFFHRWRPAAEPEILSPEPRA